MNTIDKIRKQTPLPRFLKWMGLVITLSATVCLSLSISSGNETDILPALYGMNFVIGLILFSHCRQMEINKKMVDETGYLKNEIDRLRNDLALDSNDS
jgi:hypothetical protein